MYDDLPEQDARALANGPLAQSLARSEHMTIAGFGPVVTYSRKVFIPLTNLCRDVSHYCNFASTPREVGSAYMSRDAVLAVARAGAAAALFTLGDRRAWRPHCGQASMILAAH